MDDHTVTAAQLDAAILRLKAELVEAIHGTEQRILARFDGTITALDHRVSETETTCAGCRADTAVRLAVLEKKRNGGNGESRTITDPKAIATGVAIGVATLVWFLVEKILPLLEAAK